MQRTYNITFRNVHVAIFAVENNTYYTFWVCFCSPRCPACNAHAPYLHLWPARLYSVFPRYIINGTIFEKKKLQNTKCVFWFSLQFMPEIFLMLRRTGGGTIIQVCWSPCKVYVVLVIFQWNLFFSKYFRQNAQISNFTKIRPVGAQLFRVGGRTDGQTWHVANSRFSQFCQAPRNQHDIRSGQNSVQLPAVSGAKIDNASNWKCFSSQYRDRTEQSG